MLRKALVLRLALGASVAAGPLVAVAAGPFFAEEPPQVAGAPFSAVTTTESVTVFADGNRITRTNTVYYYRDGQGRTRTERGDGPTKMISIDDPVSGERYFVRPEGKTVFAIKQPAGGHVVSEPTPPADDMGMAPFGLLGIGMGVGARPTTEASSETTDLGQKSVNGVMATGTRLVRTIPSGAIGNDKPITSTIEKWVSADLGIPVQITQTSSIGGDLSLNLGHLVRGEPDPTLFTVPAGYKVQNITMPTPTGASATGAVVSSGTATVTAVK
jgi:hypothetical protein